MESDISQSMLVEIIARRLAAARKLDLDFEPIQEGDDRKHPSSQDVYNLYYEVILLVRQLNS